MERTSRDTHDAAVRRHSTNFVNIYNSPKKWQRSRIEGRLAQEPKQHQKLSHTLPTKRELSSQSARHALTYLAFTYAIYPPP